MQTWLKTVLAGLSIVSAVLCAGQPETPKEWEKIETKLVPLRAPQQVISPAILDKKLGKTYTLAKDGKPVELELPREGKDAEGNAFPKLTARQGQDVIWVDINCDNKLTPNEVTPIVSSGYTTPIVCELRYDDGSAGQYSFSFKHIADREKFLLVRNCARTFEFQKTTIVLLDDNGNGKFNDAEADAIIVGDNPVAFLGKHIQVGEKFYEILVHAAGTTVELRAAAKMEYGIVDMFNDYTPPAKGENLRLHTVIISGPNGSFAFDDRRRTAMVPAGAYDIVFGIWERAREWVFLRRGEKTSFYAVAEKQVAPKWGTPLKTTFDLKSDGEKITVDNVRIFGAGTEEYVPETWQSTGVQLIVSKVLKIQPKFGPPLTTITGKKMDVGPDGELKEVTFKSLRTDEYEIGAEYVSNVLGRVIGNQRINYVQKKK